MSGRRGGGLLLMLAIGASGCSSTLFTVTSFRGRQGFDEAAVEKLAIRSAGTPPTKAQMIDALGPPAQVLAQSDGEIFVYRRSARDTATVNLNPSAFLQGASIPIYFASGTSGRDDVIMVFFDRHGAMRGASVRSSIDSVEGSKAARLGELFQGMLK